MKAILDFLDDLEKEIENASRLTTLKQKDKVHVVGDIMTNNSSSISLSACNVLSGYVPLSTTFLGRCRNGHID